MVYGIYHFDSGNNTRLSGMCLDQGDDQRELLYCLLRLHSVFNTVSFCKLSGKSCVDFLKSFCGGIRSSLKRKVHIF